MDELEFKGGNPGAVRFGNFINYYKFHPPSTRIKLLPKNIWDNFKLEKQVVLDLGCNAGDLTTELYFFLTTNINPKCALLGLDIDPTLIERAKEKNSIPQVTFNCSDFMREPESSELLKNYLKQENSSIFTSIFCFSITMWIHLNHGDEGLKKFLQKISEITKILVIEPQPWKCYKTAVKRMKLSDEEFPHFKTLKIRENVENEIEQYLKNACNMEFIMETERAEWGRKLLFFKCK